VSAPAIFYIQTTSSEKVAESNTIGGGSVVVVSVDVVLLKEHGFEVFD
jgi:hypothetical protein